MEKPKIKIYGVVWFSQLTSTKIIGILTLNNSYEDKAYIGVCEGKDEELDKQNLLENGSPFPFKQAIELTGKMSIEAMERKKKGKETEEILNELEEDVSPICDTCKKRSIAQTADFGGRFDCMLCGELQTMVPSAGHDKVCNDCVKKGFCKYCGEKING